MVTTVDDPVLTVTCNPAEHAARPHVDSDHSETVGLSKAHRVSIRFNLSPPSSARWQVSTTRCQAASAVASSRTCAPSRGRGVGRPQHGEIVRSWGEGQQRVQLRDGGYGAVLLPAFLL